MKKKVLAAVVLVLGIAGCVHSKTTEKKSQPVLEEVAETVQSEEPAKEEEPEESPKEQEEQPAQTNGMRPEFVDAMDSYEKFFDEYVAFMQKYNKSSGDLSLLADYSQFMNQYAETMAAMEKWESEDMTTEEELYFLEVQARINQKLLTSVQ